MRYQELFEAWHKVPVLYHGTPMYRYDPTQAKRIGIWPYDKPIISHGLVPSTSSHLYEASIYLTDSDNVAHAYAENGFGEEHPVDWVVLRIDPSAIAIDFLRSDLHGEASSASREIMAHGFTEEDWDEDRIPWWATLEETGQCRYVRPIPARAITVFEKL